MDYFLYVEHNKSFIKRQVLTFKQTTFINYTAEITVLFMFFSPLSDLYGVGVTFSQNKERYRSRPFVPALERENNAAGTSQHRTA